MHYFSSILNYLFWLSWAIIVGGISLIIILAPLAFFTLPPLTVDSAQAAIFSGKLITLLFGSFIPVCAASFWIITILEIRHYQQEWISNKKIRFFLQLFFLIVINLSFFYLAFFLIPQMESDYFSMVDTGGLTAAARQIFRDQHQFGTQLIFVCFALTLVLPYFHLTRIQQES